MKYDISVIGAGSWGSVLANMLGEKGLQVMLWSLERDVVEGIRTDRVNHLYMPGLRMSERVTPTDDISEAAGGAPILLLVVPSQFVRGVLHNMLAHMASDAIIVSAIKGIEKGTLQTASEIIRQYCPHERAVLSGPSFAAEVASGKPTAITLGVMDISRGHHLQEVFNTDYFRVYTHDDMLGIELGGALKNVIAIAAGICDGLELGLNARAALITRGLAEITRLGVKLGATARTFSGLSGMGDLVLTCTGQLSRNYTVGLQLARGQTTVEIVSEMNAVAEGVETSHSAFELSKAARVEMPIVTQVYRVIHEGKSPSKAVNELMSRQLRKEF
ncbi:MAG: NAD(P)-dependent glycerol-3-phosphate dehydrogenase [Nitrospirae bacterium]|uniref:NAD(P)H-dependent glycerol-3-phosphate dehydrogenase n=1 Tax=Candidatus Magnetobacterium casense TaxID=1455061 RepID=UPI00058D2885|nr:NAD(P)H-dependent glycerol-3-phosphate dehydrogenase [Candidatus Magnetobacterium casensis]MBF0336773.1 NAD(P)-dependent glycerol-3-phosphate dehydrogenase [Nitrospirota bacterium]